MRLHFVSSIVKINRLINRKKGKVFSHVECQSFPKDYAHPSDLRLHYYSHHLRLQHGCEQHEEGDCTESTLLAVVWEVASGL